MGDFLNKNIFYSHDFVFLFVVKNSQKTKNVLFVTSVMCFLGNIICRFWSEVDVFGPFFKNFKENNAHVRLCYS